MGIIFIVGLIAMGSSFLLCVARCENHSDAFNLHDETMGISYFVGPIAMGHATLCHFKICWPRAIDRVPECDGVIILCGTDCDGFADRVMEPPAANI